MLYKLKPNKRRKEMNINELHLSQVLFKDGLRGQQTRTVVKFSSDNTMALIEFGDESRCWYNAIPMNWHMVPNDLHDSNGKPLSVGDKYQSILKYNTFILSYCSIGSDGLIHIWDEDGRWWYERDIVKVEQQETVDDVRVCFNFKGIKLMDEQDIQRLIDRIEKAMRVENKTCI
jgi:hypothetical protein